MAVNSYDSGEDLYIYIHIYCARKFDSIAHSLQYFLPLTWFFLPLFISCFIVLRVYDRGSLPPKSGLSFARSVHGHTVLNWPIRSNFFHGAEREILF